MVKAVWTNGNEPQEQILLDVHPYGLRVYDRNGERLPGMEEILIKRAQEYLSRKLVSLDTLEKLGEERPEGYVYAYATLRQFQLPGDDYWLSYPNRDYFSLYPGDFTYRYIHQLLDTLQPPDVDLHL